MEPDSIQKNRELLSKEVMQIERMTKLKLNLAVQKKNRLFIEKLAKFLQFCNKKDELSHW